MSLQSAQNGYTLVELLVVIAIIGLITAIAAPVATTAMEAAQFRADQRAVITELRAYRTNAMHKQLQLALRNGADATILAEFRTQGLSEGTVLSVEEPIHWFADGTTTGGRIVLRRGNRSKTVVVSWLTGTVAVE